MDAIARQALAVARGLVDVPEFDTLPDDALAAWARYTRPALTDLVHHLDQPDVDKAVNVPLGERPRCPGSHEIVHGDRVDGNGIATCPRCKRPRGTFPSSTVHAERGHGPWYRIETHLVPLSAVKGTA